MAIDTFYEGPGGSLQGNSMEICEIIFPWNFYWNLINVYVGGGEIPRKFASNSMEISMEIL